MAKEPIKKTSQDLLFELSKPFRRDDIEWRAQRVSKDKMGNNVAMMLCYVTVNTVRDRLDAVMGCNWQCKHEVFGTKTICHMGLFLDDQWRWRSDGAGDTAYEADKGAISDSIKRAAVSWGVGRHLYDIKANNPSGQVWIKCDVTPNGKFKKPLEDCWTKVRTGE
jgi:hypothetical protein